MGIENKIYSNIKIRHLIIPIVTFSITIEKNPFKLDITFVTIISKTIHYLLKAIHLNASMYTINCNKCCRIYVHEMYRNINQNLCKSDLKQNKKTHTLNDVIHRKESDHNSDLKTADFIQREDNVLKRKYRESSLISEFSNLMYVHVYLKFNFPSQVNGYHNSIHAGRQ